MHRHPYLAVLGLGPTATTEEIKQRYRYLVSRWHPDRFANDPRMLPLAEETIKQINTAYTALRGAHLGNPVQEAPIQPMDTGYVSDPTVNISWPRRLAAVVMAALRQSRHQASQSTPNEPRRTKPASRRRVRAFQEILTELGAPPSRLRDTRRTKPHSRRFDRHRRAHYRRYGHGTRASSVASGSDRPQRVGRVRPIRPIGSDDG